ncbi:249_t:CDS:10, partial [Dentiscutata erythropus]
SASKCKNELLFSINSIVRHPFELSLRIFVCMTESISQAVNNETFNIDNDLTFGSIDANFSKGLDGLEKNVSSFLQDVRQPPSFNGRRLSDANELRINRNKRGSRLNSGVPSRTTQMTLKEQERVVDEIKKENFGLKMKNIEIKVQNQNLKNEIKEYKNEYNKLLKTFQQNGTDCLLQHGMSPAEEADFNRAISRTEELSQENNRIHRKLAEQQSEVKRLRELIKLTKPEFNFDDETSLDLFGSSTEHQQLKELINRDQNTKLKETLRKERDEAEGLRQQILDLKNQLTESNLELKRLQDAPMVDDWDMGRKINDAADKARQDEIEKLKEQITNLDKQLASRTNENDDLYSEFEMIKGPLSSTSSRGDIASRIFSGEFSEQYEESLGHLRDKVAELTLQLREKSIEVDQLVAELERNTLAHSTSVQDFEDEMDRMEGQFQEETALLRDQLDELQNENDQLVYELETLDRICQESDIRYEESKAQLENQQREILELSQSVEKDQTELENKSKELISMTESLKKDKEAYEKELERLRKEKKESEKQYEQRIIELNEKLSTAQLQIADVNLTIQERDADLQYVRQQLGNQTNRTKDTADRYVKEHERLRVELDTMRQESEQLRTQLEIVGDELENKKTFIIEYENEIKHLNNIRTKLNEKIVASDAVRSKSEEIIRNLQMEIRDKNSTIDELRAQIAYLENRIKELEYREKETGERLQIEKQNIENQLQAQNRRNTQLQEMISMQKASMEEATNESKVREAKVENTFAMLNEQLREQLDEKNKTIENERRRVKNLEEQFSSMLEEQKRLHSQIERRETTINKVLNGLQMINQRKDVMENAALKNITEDMQITLSLDRKPSYQPPVYINPPWKPAGTNLNAKKTVVKNPSTKSSSIPVSLKSKGVSSNKSLIPTPSEK